jgi:thymidylate synthase (FAD)
MSRINVLDHGYLEFVESWGSDERIVEAARMSTGKGFLGWGPKHSLECIDTAYRDGCSCGGVPGDEKLLRYLYEHKHATPFEMAGLVIEVQAPIFVFREWHRHRTQSYNEMSGRYTPLPNLNYVPTVERLLINSKTNKQAGVIKGAAELTEEGAECYQATLQLTYRQQQNFYEDALAMGIPKELARIHLPVARYSRMRASANLRNWLGFLTLRMDPAAQWEIREFANALASIVEDKFPRTYELFNEGLKK